MARFTFQTPARRTISQWWVPPAAGAPYWSFRFVSSGEFIGVLNARRIEVRPFTPAQIKLLETFADQAVIAIENVRLFKELEDRNRQLTEALEQQTATSEILGVIASSPTDIQPVLDAVAEMRSAIMRGIDGSIYRIDGDILRPVAHMGRFHSDRLIGLSSRFCGRPSCHGSSNGSHP